MAQEQLSLAQPGVLQIAIGVSDTVLTLAQAPGFPPAPPFGLFFSDTGEYLRVVGVSGLTYQVIRAQGFREDGTDKTIAAPHPAQALCYLVPNYYNLLDPTDYTGGPLAQIWLFLHNLNQLGG